MFGIGLDELVFVGVSAVLSIGGIALLVILPFWKIFSKAGYSGWLSLTLLIPFINIVMIFFLAFSEWPVHKQEVCKTSDKATNTE
jgi:hypothetical protein